MNELINFSYEEGNLLIRLLLAHLLSDFVLQTRRMVENKKWYSFGLLSHIVVTMLMVFVLTGMLKVMLIIGITHYIIDISKTILTKKYPARSFFLFIIDQVAHILVIFLVWGWELGKIEALFITLKEILSDYNISLVLIGYVFCIWPSAYIVKFAVQNLLNAEDLSKESSEKIQNGGKWIGQFERVLIFTFVLLSEYSAIGFLITGKSIIRFADKEQMKSEYVLVGTLLSFMLAILAGVLVNWLLVK